MPCSPGLSPRSSVIPRDVQHAGSVAANDQPRLVDRQLLQAQLEKQQRIPGNGQPHVGQGHARDTGTRLRDAQIADVEPRVPAVPGGSDRADFHRLADLAVSRRATTSGLLSTRGKMTKRTASSNKQTAMRAINAIARAELRQRLAKRSKEGRGRARSCAREGIIGRSGAILIRKGAAAALNSRMDLAGAYEFSRYAQRLRVADPGLCASVEAMSRPAFPMVRRRTRRVRPWDPIPRPWLLPLRRLRQRVYLHVSAARPDRTRRSERSLRDDDAAGRERDRRRSRRTLELARGDPRRAARRG